MYGVRSASSPFEARVCESVKGTPNSSGSVPPASWAAKVGPVQLYSSPLTMMSGFFFSNVLTWVWNAASDSALAPGCTWATTISVWPLAALPPLDEQPLRTTLAAATPATARMMDLLGDFIVLPFLICLEVTESVWGSGLLGLYFSVSAN